MIGYLRAILTALLRVLDRQDEAASQATADHAAVESEIETLKGLDILIENKVDALAAAVEHLRVLIEDSDPNPAVVGAPTFTPQE